MIVGVCHLYMKEVRLRGISLLPGVEKDAVRIGS